VSDHPTPPAGKIWPFASSALLRASTLSLGIWRGQKIWESKTFGASPLAFGSGAAGALPGVVIRVINQIAPSAQPPTIDITPPIPVHPAKLEPPQPIGDVEPIFKI
jgi:hypothetical protein